MSATPARGLLPQARPDDAQTRELMHRLLAKMGSVWTAEESVDLCDLEASADLIDFPRLAPHEEGVHM